MKKTFFSDFVKPVLVLFFISLAVAFLLSYVNQLTAPVIAENNEKQKQETRLLVLPGAAGFEEIDATDFDVNDIAKEVNGLGYVISASKKGYGGLVTVTAGLSPEGEIIQISVDVSTETKGIGSKTGDAGYTDRFIGLSGSSDSVDTLSGATYSSTAVKDSVDRIFKAYTRLMEGGEQ